MPRLNLLLIAPLLLALTPALHAQQLADLTPHPIYPQPDAHIDDPWSPASNLNKRFPLQVRLSFQDNHFNGYYYTGTGTARLSGSSLPFHYNCGLTFDEAVYQARWIKPGKKLAILMQQPYSHHTASCRIYVTSTSAKRRQQAPPS
jgi:hypothetical protein